MSTICMPIKHGQKLMLPDNGISACDRCMCFAQYREKEWAFAQKEFGRNRLMMVCVGCSIRLMEENDRA